MRDVEVLELQLIASSYVRWVLWLAYFRNPQITSVIYRSFWGCSAT
jgi:hypothetical protein